MLIVPDHEPLDEVSDECVVCGVDVWDDSVESGQVFMDMWKAHKTCATKKKLDEDSLRDLSKALKEEEKQRFSTVLEPPLDLA